MKVTKITLARLYNLGSYEHVRYELSVDLGAGDSAANAMLGLEHIMSALNPKTSTSDRPELERKARRINELKTDLAASTGEAGENEFRRKHGHFEGTPEEYVSRCEQSFLANVAKRTAWEERAQKARKLLDDLGGAVHWKDAKLDWESDADY